MSVYIGNLSYTVTSDELTQVFNQYGVVRKVQLPMDRETGQARGPNAELAELARVLKPGGELHLAVPNGQAVCLSIDGLDWHQLSHPFHFWYFDVDNLVELLRRHGFEPVGRPVTTTRHHAWGAWWTGCRSGTGVTATRRLVRYLRESLSIRDGGDSIRLIAKLRA